MDDINISLTTDLQIFQSIFTFKFQNKLMFQ